MSKEQLVTLGDRTPEPWHFALLVPVWGDSHTELFLRYCVPFLLTEGNVGAFAGKQLQVHIVSTRADLARMRKQTCYQQLAARTDMVETEVDGIIDLSMPHRAMTQCYALALRTLPPNDRTVTIFLTPDCIVSRNTLGALVRLIDDGFRAVMVCGLRLNLDTAGPKLDATLNALGGPENLDDRRLCDLALPHLHPISLGCDVASPAFTAAWPSHLYWRADDHAWLLAHCFHLHPLAVRGVPDLIDAGTTIDGDYLLDLKIAPHEVKICSDPDGVFCFELSPANKILATETAPLTQHALIRFSVRYCNALHRRFFAVPILFRGAREPVIPADVDRQADAFVSAVARGSVTESAIHAVISAIKRYPRIERIARRAVRLGRQALNRTRQLARS